MAKSSLSQLFLSLKKFDLDLEQLKFLYSQFHTKIHPSAQKFYRVKEMAANDIHPVPAYNIKTMTDEAKVQREMFKLFWKTFTIEEDKLTQAELKFTMMKNHFDNLKNQFEISRKSEERVINFIEQRSAREMKTLFAERKKAQKTLTKQFKTTNEMSNKMANSNIDVEIEKNKDNERALEHDIRALKRTIEMNRAFISSSKKLLIFGKNQMDKNKKELETQISKTTKDLNDEKYRVYQDAFKKANNCLRNGLAWIFFGFFKHQRWTDQINQCKKRKVSKAMKKHKRLLKAAYEFTDITVHLPDWCHYVVHIHGLGEKLVVFLAISDCI